jgi:hypothetical protein
LEPQNLNFGGGVSQTFLSPIVLVAIMIAGIMICASPRSRALAAFLTASILIPMDQVLLVGSVHFPMLRILAVCGLVRVLWTKFSKKEQIFTGGLNGIDWGVIVSSLFKFINGIVLWQATAQVIYQVGNLIDIFGIYCLLRLLIRGLEDVKQSLRALACIAAVLALFMAYEQATGKNLIYSTLGGARANVLSSVLDRDDHLRAAGSFLHPILAGTFGGILLPLFVGFWVKEKKERTYAVIGIAACCVIPFAASSSTALFGFLGGILGLCFWPLRRQMRSIRWAVVIVLVTLHLAMNAPVWHLISRIDLTGSSSSYHRYQLINQCIVHFWDWMLVGTKYYADWGWDMWDLSNQYVAIADVSGLIPLAGFLATIVLGFRYVGRARRMFKTDRKQQFFVWAFGASLFANVVAFFGISYFDQTIVAWYALLAMISAVAVSARVVRRDGGKQGSTDEVLAMSRHNDTSVEIAHVTIAESLVGGMSGFGERQGVLS